MRNSCCCCCCRHPLYICWLSKYMCSAQPCQKCMPIWQHSVIIRYFTNYMWPNHLYLTDEGNLSLSNCPPIIHNDCFPLISWQDHMSSDGYIGPVLWLIWETFLIQKDNIGLANKGFSHAKAGYYWTDENTYICFINTNAE